MSLARSFIPQTLLKSPFTRFPAFFEDLEDEMSQFANLQNFIQNDIHIETDEKNIFVKVPMPGFDPNEIDINLRNGVLFIRGEKKQEEKKEREKSRKIYRQATRLYTYTLTLPEQVDENADIKATNENGLLTIELPKAQKGQTKKITVKKK